MGYQQTDRGGIDLPQSRCETSINLISFVIKDTITQHKVNINR
jgi:hypothetical protein